MHAINLLQGLLLTYWSDVLLILMAVLVVVYLFKRGKGKIVLKFAKFIAPRIINGLVAEAEKQFGSKTGNWKRDFVYARLPLIVKMLFTEEEVISWIDMAAKKLQEGLEKGEFNFLSYAEERINQQPVKNITVNVTKPSDVDPEEVAKLLSEGLEKEFAKP